MVRSAVEGLGRRQGGPFGVRVWSHSLTLYQKRPGGQRGVHEGEASLVEHPEYEAILAAGRDIDLVGRGRALKLAAPATGGEERDE